MSLGGVAAALATVCLLACSAPRDAGPPAAVSAGPELELELEVQTAQVRRGSVEASISAPATLEAQRESRIGPEVQGTLLHVFVDEGDRVEAGAPLFEVDPTPYRFALRQAEAGLEEALEQVSEGEVLDRLAQDALRQATASGIDDARVVDLLCTYLTHDNRHLGMIEALRGMLGLRGSATN